MDELTDGHPMRDRLRSLPSDSAGQTLQAAFAAATVAPAERRGGRFRPLAVVEDAFTQTFIDLIDMPPPSARRRPFSECTKNDWNSNPR